MLGSNVERLELLGSANLRGTGNATDNTLVGNSGNNALDGRSGADTMAGGAGNDTYYVDNIGDTVQEKSSGGTLDTVFTSVDYTLGAGVHVEKLLAGDFGSTADFDLTGNGIGQQIIANNGDSFINGKAGSDTLTGNLGQDRFIFDTALGASNVDTITDFSAVDDGFRLDDAIFSILALVALPQVLSRILLSLPRMRAIAFS
jgi:Ca2+-binding RTX toxin-like protein